MTEHELLQAISDIMDRKIAPLKEDIQTMDQKIQAMDQKITGIELTLENATNHNIQLLAENHMNLIDKLNQAIRVSDKTLFIRSPGFRSYLKNRTH